MKFRFVVSYLILSVITFFSLSAELWANNKPIVMRYHGRLFLPVTQNVSATDLGQTDRVVPEYRELKFEANDFAIWPLNRWSPLESNLEVDEYPSRPTSDNWFGTDDRGRDVFARLLYGSRITLAFSVAVWIGCVLLALLIGGFSGSRGGWVDVAVQRVIETFSSVPQFFVLMFLVSLFQPSLKILIAVTTVFGWVGLSFYIRAEVLKLKKLEFVEAARGYGASEFRILTKYLLPNALGPVVTLAPFMIIANFSELLALDFLGLGLPQPTPSWGEMLVQGQRYMGSAWWLAISPSIATLFILMSLSFVGEHLRGLSGRRI